MSEREREREGESGESEIVSEREREREGESGESEIARERAAPPPSRAGYPTDWLGGAGSVTHATLFLRRRDNSIWPSGMPSSES